jgi:polysaccharide chain length determinant protein (PEP-CTERM system associated)
MDDFRAIILGYLDGFWRRRWTGMAVAWLVCVVGWTVVAVLPNRYQAEARIYVDTDTLLAPLLHGIAVRANVDQQVQIMQRTLLSRPNLQQVVRMTDLDLRAQDTAQREAIVDRLQQSTTMRADSARNLFRLTYDDPDPRVAQRVVQSLLTIFVESQLGSKRRDMVQAQGFLDQQIKEYEAALQASEQRLAEFRQRNMDVVEGGGTFSQRIATANAERAKVAMDLSETRIRHDNLRVQLDATPEMRDLRGTAAGPANVDALQAQRQLQEARRQIDALLLRYTEQHPDVVAARRLVATLQAQARGAGAAEGQQRTTITQVPNIVHEQLRLRLVDEEARLSTQQRRLEQADLEIEKLRGMAQRALDIEAQFANLNRDYAVLKGNHEQLLARREQARLAQAAEERTDTVQFRIVDPPRLPVDPSAPNRLLLFSGVLAAGLAIGAGASLLLSQFQDSFTGVDRLREVFALPVLGMIAARDTPFLRRRRVLGAVAFGSAALALIGLYGGLLVASPRLPLSLEALQFDRFTRILAEAR